MGEPEAGAGALGRVFAVVFILLIGFTTVLVVLSFPAGFYATFWPGSGQPWTATTPLFLLIGPFILRLPFAANVGGYFVFLNLVYLSLFAYLLTRPRSPLSAMTRALREGVGALTSSPFLVSLISISFLIFTAALIERFASSNGPPTTLLSLTQAPLIEEFGFRVLLIGVFAALLSLNLPWRRVLGALWRPSSAYEGGGGGLVRTVVIVLLFASSVVFGAAHVLAGWDFVKIYEATYGGLVLGYLYIRYGFAFAVLAHWGIDYLDTVFSFFGQTAFGVPVTARPEFYLQAAVDYDMLQLLGFASFLLVVYLGLRRLQARSEGSEVHKDAPEGSVFGI